MVPLVFICEHKGLHPVHTPRLPGGDNVPAQTPPPLLLGSTSLDFGLLVSKLSFCQLSQGDIFSLLVSSLLGLPKSKKRKEVGTAGRGGRNWFVNSFSHFPHEGNRKWDSRDKRQDGRGVAMTSETLSASHTQNHVHLRSGQDSRPETGSLRESWHFSPGLRAARPTLHLLKKVLCLTLMESYRVQAILELAKDQG